MPPSPRLGRPKSFNIDWRVLATNALPLLIELRRTKPEHSLAYVHIGEAIALLKPVIHDLSITNARARAALNMAGHHLLQAFYLRREDNG